MVKKTQRNDFFFAEHRLISADSIEINLLLTLKRHQVKGFSVESSETSPWFNTYIHLTDRLVISAKMQEERCLIKEI